MKKTNKKESRAEMITREMAPKKYADGGSVMSNGPVTKPVVKKKPVAPAPAYAGPSDKALKNAEARVAVANEATARLRNSGPYGEPAMGYKPAQADSTNASNRLLNTKAAIVAAKKKVVPTRTVR